MKTYDQALTDFATLTSDASFGPTMLFNMAVKYVMNLADWNFNKISTTITTVASKQEYILPYNTERINFVNVYANAIYYTPREIKDGKVWRQINYVTTNYSDVPLYWFFRNSNSTIQIYPIPANSGNTITVGYTKKLRDFAYVGTYDTGKMTTTANSNVIVGSGGAAWDNSMLGMSILIEDAVKSIGIYNEIIEVTNATHLKVRFNIPEIITTSDYAITEMVPFLEGFEDIMLWFAMDKYYQIKEIPAMAKQYEQMWREALEQMKARDQRSVDGVLKKETPVPLIDPNRDPWSLTIYPLP
jgi:hypothetical protein